MTEEPKTNANYRDPPADVKSRLRAVRSGGHAVGEGMKAIGGAADGEIGKQGGSWQRADAAGGPEVRDERETGRQGDRERGSRPSPEPRTVNLEP